MPGPSLDTLRDLLRHMEWADASVWRAISAHPPALQDGRLRDLLAHLHTVQRAFFAMWTDRSPDDEIARMRSLDLPSTASLARDYYSQLHDTIARFDDERLRRPIATPGMLRYEEQHGVTFARPTLAETMLQVASHSTYHRGQVNARLREIGSEPPLVDFIAWIWFGRPEAEWTKGETLKTAD